MYPPLDSYPKGVGITGPIENGSPSNSNFDERGRTGPIEITFLHIDNDILPWAQKQSLAMGITLNDNSPTGGDYSATPSLVGIWPMQRSLKRGIKNSCVRQSAYDTYIKEDISMLQNLKVIDKTNAVKLINNPLKPKSIIGVRIVRDGCCHSIIAQKEVIVSAGTLGSVKLLELSGICDSSASIDRDITPITNLPGVGENLQDHAVVQFGYYLPTATTITTESSVIISFLKSGHNGNHVDIEIAWGLFPTSTLGFPPGTPGAIVLGFVVQVRGAGIGSSHIRSSNYSERMNVTLGFNPNNMLPLIYGLDKVREWLSEEGTELLPGPAYPADGTIEDKKKYLSSSVEGWYHMAGTCKIGPVTDPMAVVDDKLETL